ncbi:hypothetical protein SAMN04515617_1233 [Collimonas sp. OK242]|uniref:hypothetical protein n=1 Tax=Collimonas sp. OK242 TaxID=1798195 RepID=UPI0008941ED0|nr:hypothetical protein [Collimonas sp. OK242]SDY80776.1 hypothetical protein SAMN04515617_1233 [Collimonas sp. OK242]
MHIEKPVLGQITQGTIFTAASAENYQLAPVWGLCITARCDMAHENKIRVFNYVPIVRYEDWLREDGARVLIDRIGAEVLNAARNFLTTQNKSESVLDSYSPTQIAELLFPDGGKFHEIARKLDIVSHARNSLPLDSKTLCELVAVSHKTAERLVKELWANQLAGYYFFDNIGSTEHESKYGYVVMLREIHHIPRNVATDIANGSMTEESTIHGHGPIHLNARVFDFAYTTGVIRSPWIEHFLQQFSLMFSRIGLPDPTLASLKILNEAVIHVA